MKPMQQSLLIEPRTIEVFVPGTPIPQGSMVAYWHKALRRATLKPDNERDLKAWRAVVRTMARLKWIGKPATCAVRVEAEFRFPRVKQTAAGPRRMQTPRPTTRQVPDGDKLLRAVLDALTGAIYVDDAQVIEASTRKTFVEREGDAGLFLRVTELPD